MTVINTNVQSLIAQNSLSVNGRNLTNAMEQLSTGKRINGASDDAAGLAISQKMTSQIRGLNQAVRNANDGISLVQTAEGALVEVSNMLQRMRELAVQSANDTNADKDRMGLNQEYQQLKQEIDRIGSNTQFNGMNILDGSFASSTGDFVFQVGANEDQTISITIGDFRSGDSAGAAAVSSTLQSSTVTLSGGYKEGDSITINANGNQFVYKVTAEDLAGGSGASDLALIGSSVAAAAGAALGVTASNSGGVVKLSNASSFLVSASTSGGQLSGIEDTDITSRGNANTAIGALDTALSTVSGARADMGAIINRLTYASDNLMNVSTNAQESRSRILDTDYAATTTELARTQIIQQAATAMLAQANQQPQTVLSLLQ